MLRCLGLGKGHAAVSQVIDNPVINKPISTPTPGRACTAPPPAPLTSRETGRIAVKVINDDGDKGMKVFEV